ncbi:nuclear transport factor 2 family protein [Catenovulum adriaticum]|uniref:Nuclear transport factor 2 family protein n=1 Tax=Catenovulum adriaticum TaxID=2984846 RepID=A0ABY7APK1_9ALTE|nr:nuclear transport factor 2 family protein [Catenovulum sp. TS8]WAJ71488.1 nuclear transport factor 2 family protein [Catenovulum sp. TS8]
MHDIKLDAFIDVYQALNIQNIERLDSIYHPSIQFIDPLHHIHGLIELKQYLAHMYQNTISCQFNILSKQIVNDQAFLTWVMTYQHKKIGSGNCIEVDGVSRLKFDQDKVIFHRDYFDLTQMLFDHLPVIGCTSKYIKQKAASV